MATSALRDLGLDYIPVVGLAKKAGRSIYPWKSRGTDNTQRFTWFDFTQKNKR